MEQPGFRAGPGGENPGRHTPSWYAATARGVSAPALSADTQADCVVIGGGFTGLGAARRLAELGRDVLLLEAGPLGWGASGRNGGQAHIGWNKDQPWLEAKLGKPRARALWQIAMAARDHLDGLLARDPDNCDFRAGLIHADHKPGFVRETHAAARYLREEYGYDHLQPLSRDELRALVASDNYHGGSIDHRAGHCHPLKLAEALARAALAAGARLHPHSPALGLVRDGAGWRITTAAGTVRAGQVLLATGGYNAGLWPALDAHVLPINNYIATTAPLGEARARALIGGGHAVADSRFVVYYFRITPDHRLLFGGGESYRYRFPADIAGFVRPHMLRIFPQLADVAIDHAWGGTLSITPHRLPLLRDWGQGLVSASGFSGLGLVLAPYLGAAIGEAMAGTQSETLDALMDLPAPRFPGGPLLRWPTMVAALSWFALRDRI